MLLGIAPLGCKWLRIDGPVFKCRQVIVERADLCDSLATIDPVDDFFNALLFGLRWPVAASVRQAVHWPIATGGVKVVVVVGMARVELQRVKCLS